MNLRIALGLDMHKLSLFSILLVKSSFTFGFLCLRLQRKCFEILALGALIP